jgi:DNA-binding transcriptional MocR family regulator
MKSGKNYFVCNRSLFKNPLWYGEKFTKGQAWVDLFGNANHSDGWFEKNGQRVDVKRGQTGRSIESLSTDWKWSRNKVKRFLKRLEDEHMIERKTNHLTTIITICNYDKFQFDEKTSEPPNELPDEPSNEPSLEPQTNKKKRRNKEEIIKPENVTDQTWDDFLLHRKKKKATVTQTVINGFIKQAGLAKWTLEDALKETIERGWVGFKAEWVKGKPKTDYGMTV